MEINPPYFKAMDVRYRKALIKYANQVLDATARYYGLINHKDTINRKCQAAKNARQDAYRILWSTVLIDRSRNQLYLSRHKAWPDTVKHTKRLTTSMMAKLLHFANHTSVLCMLRRIGCSFAPCTLAEYKAAIKLEKLELSKHESLECSIL